MVPVSRPTRRTLYRRKTCGARTDGRVSRPPWTLSASIQAGWADGYPEDAVRIFVESINFEKAKQIIEDYFENRKSTDDLNEKN